MDLTRALEAYGSPEFDDILVEELNERADELPTEQGCDAGRPVDVAVFNVGNVTDHEDFIKADLVVNFDELVAEGCGAIAKRIPRFVDCRLTILKRDGSAQAEYVEPELPEEF